MATTTANLGLTKPAGGEAVSVATLNANADKVDQLAVIQITANNVSALPHTISNGKILERHTVIQSVLSNPAAQIGDWTWTTANGSLTISGSISGATNITLYLARLAN